MSSSMLKRRDTILKKPCASSSSAATVEPSRCSGNRRWPAGALQEKSSLKRPAGEESRGGGEVKVSGPSSGQMTSWSAASRGFTGARAGARRHRLQELRLRSINIQWPFAQLILLEVKSVELRKYAFHMQHGGDCYLRAGEQVWLVETPGSQRNALELTDPELLDKWGVSVRPRHARVVGSVSFDRCSRYDGRRSYRNDAVKHLMAVDGKYGWKSDAELWAWHVAQVSPLETPIRTQNFFPQDLCGCRRYRFHKDVTAVPGCMS